MGSAFTKIGNDYVELNEDDLNSADSYAPFFALCKIIGAIILGIVILCW